MTGILRSIQLLKDSLTGQTQSIVFAEERSEDRKAPQLGNIPDTQGRAIARKGGSVLQTPVTPDSWIHAPCQGRELLFLRSRLSGPIEAFAEHSDS